MGYIRLKKMYLGYLYQLDSKAWEQRIKALDSHIEEGEALSSWLTPSEVMVDTLFDFEARRLAEPGSDPIGT